MVGRFSFVQIAAPSRSVLEEYQTFEGLVRALATHINQRFANSSYQPVYLRIEHHEPEDINRYYRAADVCMVTSLHDGMNLVAKEYVAARDDEKGVLLLSQFTGAAHELYEALIVNPYHIEQTANALYQALTMPEFEQQERMRSMRSMVRDFNVYRWAGRMLIDASKIRKILLTKIPCLPSIWTAHLLPLYLNPQTFTFRKISEKNSPCSISERPSP